MRSDSYSDACGKHDGASGGEIWIGSGVCVEMSAYQYTVLSDHNSDHDIIYMRVLCAGGTCPALTEVERSAEQSGIREVKRLFALNIIYIGLPGIPGERENG